MRVQVKTTLGGIFGRMFLAAVLGGMAALAAEHRGWFDSLPTTPTVAVPSTPTPTPTPSSTRHPSTRPATVAVAKPTKVPPGWTDFFGIRIPPPGSNDHP